MNEAKAPPPALPGEEAPAGLLSRIGDDLRPIEPLAPPWRRLLFYLPVGLALIAAMPWVWGLRANAGHLGFFATWGLSALQTLVGLLIVGVALFEAVPGRELSPRALAVTGLAAVALFAGLTFTTQYLEPNQMRPGVALRFAWECFWMATVWSVPALAAAAWLAYRALPTRPAVAGAICGLGSGLIADAGVRLFCWVSEPAHVLFAHGGAIVFLVGLGAGAAVLLDRWR